MESPLRVLLKSTQLCNCLGVQMLEVLRPMVVVTGLFTTVRAIALLHPELLVSR